MVVNEFLKNRCNSGVRDALYFWRDNIDTEVALILESEVRLNPCAVHSGQVEGVDGQVTGRARHGISTARIVGGLGFD
ncbi:MAG: hypothetical protein FD135_1974 [Comamonadaceae bacterium]|nr:MAG: hypothetical protein FD135_1974 [Comamonadaceae bacterium]